MNLRSLLDTGDGSAVALSAPDRQPLTYDQLYQHVDKIGRQLAG